MLLHVASDLHCEFFTDGGRALISTFDSSGVDGIILAGDCFTATSKEVAARFFHAVGERGYKYKIFVSGNHEMYRSDLEIARNRIKAAAEENDFYYLEPGKVLLLEGQRFIGSTLWFPYNPLALAYQAGMTDFHVISGFVPKVYEWNRQAVKFFVSEMRAGDVVVTHHLPSFRSVPEKYRHSPLNHFFVHDLEKLILARKPKLYVHGHTHTACDYMLGSTRVVCEPRGYPGSKEIKLWNPKKIVEV